jgi:hypothetical protein
VQSSGGILLGDLNGEDKELRLELKDETDFFALLSRGDFLCPLSILTMDFFGG